MTPGDPGVFIRIRYLFLFETRFKDAFPLGNILPNVSAVEVDTVN